MAKRDISLDELETMEKKLDAIQQQVRDVRVKMFLAKRDSFPAQLGTFYYHIQKLKPVMVSINAAAERTLVTNG